ncbi:hypothetical protein MTO96_029581 [Rhipicephalus appendiculatus]
MKASLRERRCNGVIVVKGPHRPHRGPCLRLGPLVEPPQVLLPSIERRGPVRHASHDPLLSSIASSRRYKTTSRSGSLAVPWASAYCRRPGNVNDAALAKARAILFSMLAPWQRLDALRRIVYPALNYMMRCWVLSKRDRRRFDDAIRPLTKRTLNLPGNASNHHVYGSAPGGAVGHTPLHYQSKIN